ncbi:MAG: SUMF1/EgtB/PvdO family nonheme iron enzyme [Proteobacteria bacterium]|nr:SUMF1/EgtB/PvdO family nonheme iron enzyme [Pseudomonadota bacterium]
MTRSSRIKILFLGVSPTDCVHLRVDAEVRRIKERLRRGSHRDRFELIYEPAVRTSDLSLHLAEHAPHIVHISSHGASSDSGELVFEDSTGNAKPVPVAALAKLFSTLQGRIRCVVLSACHSEQQATALIKHIDCVIGVSSQINDHTAAIFAERFYGTLSCGKSIQTAFTVARNDLQVDCLQGGRNIVLLTRHGIQPADVHFLTTQVRCWRLTILLGAAGITLLMICAAYAWLYEPPPSIIMQQDTGLAGSQPSGPRKKVTHSGPIFGADAGHQTDVSTAPIDGTANEVWQPHLQIRGDIRPDAHPRNGQARSKTFRASPHSSSIARRSTASSSSSTIPDHSPPDDVLMEVSAKSDAMQSAAANTLTGFPSTATRPALVFLQGGVFAMGASKGEQSSDIDEHPRHQVEVSSFYLCQTEITQGHWAAVMGNNPSECRYGCRGALPVQNVSWSDTLKYLNRLSTGEGLSPCYLVRGETVTWDRACDGYRLPTEAEWEYAARAETTTSYAFGDNPQALNFSGWYDGNSSWTVHPVAAKRSNAWQLYDMHGNVWEFVWDSYGDYSSGMQLNPTGPEIGTNTRVKRGGSFGDAADLLRSASRMPAPVEMKSQYDGFRCARTPGRR